MLEPKQRTPVRLLLSLLAGVVIALAGLLLVRFVASAAWLHANNEVAGNYLQTLGTIYAVLLAFVVFVVWQQHNETRCAVVKEANELADFRRTVQALPGTEPVIERLESLRPGGRKNGTPWREAVGAKRPSRPWRKPGRHS